MRENAIEWVTGSDRATVTFSQTKYINRVMKIAEDDPKSVTIIKMPEENGGYLLADIDLRRVSLTKKPKISEDMRQRMAEQLKRNTE